MAGNSITLGELGFRVRGTLYNSVGYYLRASNGQKLDGDTDAVTFARKTDPKLFAQYKFEYEQKNFDTFDGYLRYQTDGELDCDHCRKKPCLSGIRIH